MHNSVFLVCSILLNLYVVHVLCCICKFYLLAMSGFNARLVNVSNSFLFLSSLVRFEWVVFSGHFITKSYYHQAKIFAGLVICVLATSLFSFSRAMNFILIFHILILHCTVVLVPC